MKFTPILYTKLQRLALMQLNRRNTMKRAYEFSLVRQKGVSKPGRFLVLSLAALPQEEQNERTRVGLIATKRVGCAVERNRLRRRMREIIRAHAAPIEQGHYLVIIMRKSASKVTYQELEQDYLRCQKRIIKTLAK